MFHPQLNRNQKGKTKSTKWRKQTSTHKNINPTLLLPRNGARKELDNPQVQGINVAIPNGGIDKYGVSNPQGAKGKINILSSPICHWYESTYTKRLLPTRNKK